MTVPEAIIVGAGIVGAACAEALAQDGVRVRVYDAGRPAGVATAAGMGHVLVLDDSAAQFALTHWSRTLWNERAAEWPAAVEQVRCGTIWVAADDEEMAAVHAKHAWYRDRSVRSDVLDATTLRRLEPNLRDGLAGGLRIADDGVIYPPAAARHLLDNAVRCGAELIERTPVRRAGDGYIELADGARVEAGRVVVAAGLATPQIVADGAVCAVRAKKGHLAITARCPGFVNHQLVELGYLKSAHGAARESVAFNIQPRATGQVLLGSSRQLDDAGPAVDAALLARMIARGIEFMPGLARLPVIRTWVGVRPATDDNLPWIGSMPGRDRLWLAAGHEGVGITTSLGTARLLADLWHGRPCAIDPRPYAPDRPRVAEASHG